MLQTICIFMGGYLISRLVLRAEAHTLFVSWLSHHVQRVAWVALGLMLGGALLSSFLPNTLTTLALLPIVSALRSAAKDAPVRLGTVLALCLIYASNMGGMISVTGTPANLYLLVTLRFYEVTGWEDLRFLNWLAFGLPLTLVLIGLAWLQLLITESAAMRYRMPPDPLPRRHDKRLRWSAIWAVAWLAVWFVILTTEQRPPLSIQLASGTIAGTTVVFTVAEVIGLVFTALVVLGLFIIPHPMGAKRETLMTLGDTRREFPTKGILVVVVVLAAVYAIAKSGVIEAVNSWAPRLLPDRFDPFTANLLLTGVTTFATELLHNTTVATVMYPLAILITKQVGMRPVYTMLGVSLASNCAFMTPVATPVNALVYGSIRGVQVQRMLLNGFITNLLAMLFISACITWWVPRLL